MSGYHRTAGLAAVALGAGAAIVFAPAVLAVAVPLALGAVVLRALVRVVTRDEGPAAEARLAMWVGGGLVAHLLVGWFGHTTNIAVDAHFYDRLAQQVVDHWRHGFPFEPLPFGKEGFIYLLAALYRVFGHYPAAGVAVNCVLGAATIPVVYDTTKRLFNAEAARFVGPLLMLPAFLIWTSTLLREAAILLLMATALNAGVRLSDRFGAGRFIVMGASLTLLFTFRANVALLLMASLLPALVVSRRELLSGLGTGLTVTAMILMLVVGGGIGYSGYKLTSGASLEQVEVSRDELATTAESGFSHGADVSTTKGAITYLPLGLTNFMLGPFPWQARGARQLLALPDVLLWWALLPSLCRGMVHGVRVLRRKTLLLFMPAGLIAAVLSLLIGNFGTAVRERLQVLIVLLPLIAVGLARRSSGQSPSTDLRAPAAVGGSLPLQTSP